MVVRRPVKAMVVGSNPTRGAMIPLRKDIESGQRNELTFGPKGELFIASHIINQESGQSEKIRFLVDTGFNGVIQLPQSLVEKLGLKIIGKGKTTLADGSKKETGIIKTKIKILDTELQDVPAQISPGNAVHLIGTEFLKGIGQMLIIDYKSGIATLTGNKRVQNKVHKAVEKYAG